jgi:hypothetical protein
MLCEENFLKLINLIPNFEHGIISNAHVHMQVLESGPFTYTILLNDHAFEDGNSSPYFKCRVYLDTKAVEVLSIEDVMFAQSNHQTSPRDVLNNKWSLNYLFEKWLTFQLQLSKTEQTAKIAINA